MKNYATYMDFSSFFWGEVLQIAHPYSIPTPFMGIRTSHDYIPFNPSGWQNLAHFQSWNDRTVKFHSYNFSNCL